MDMKLELKMTLIDAEEGEAEIAAESIINNIDQANMPPGELVSIVFTRLLHKMMTEGLEQVIATIESQQASA